VARERYRQRFGEHAAGLARVCSKLGVDLMRLATDQPLEMALFDILSARLKRGRQVSRRQQSLARGSAGGSR
jgi:hypothetical protein